MRDDRKIENGFLPFLSLDKTLLFRDLKLYFPREILSRCVQSFSFCLFCFAKNTIYVIENGEEIYYTCVRIAFELLQAICKLQMYRQTPT